METKDFTLINKFRIDILDFEIYKNEAGQFMTTCRSNESDNATKDEPIIYKDFEQLHEIFSDDFTEKELKEIVSGKKGFT